MKKHLLFAGAGLLAGISLNAQWVTENSGFATASRGITQMYAVDANVVWAAAYNGANPSKNTNDFTRTSNGGTTWTADSIKATPAIPQTSVISNIAPISKDTAWACMYSLSASVAGGIFRTNNAGVTWTMQSTAAFNLTSFPDFVYFWDKNNGIAFGDPNPGFEIYTTSNGGTTWTAVPSANIPASLAGEYGNVNGFSQAGGTIWAATTMGRVLKSVDKGMHWTVGTAMANRGLNKVVFKDASNGLATIGDTIMRSTDGGGTWNMVTKTGRFLHNDLCFASGATGAYVCTGAATGLSGSSYSIDNGTTLVIMDTAIQHTAVAFVNTATGWSGGFNTSSSVGGMFKWASPLGILEHTLTSGTLTVYPNPTTGSIQISLENGTGKQNQVTIYDLVGNVVFQSAENTSSALLNVDLSNVPAGMYIVQVIDGQKRFTSKVIRQ